MPGGLSASSYAEHTVSPTAQLLGLAIFVTSFIVLVVHVKQSCLLCERRTRVKNLLFDVRSDSDMPRIVVKPTAGGNKVTVELEHSNATVSELKERLSGDLSCPVEQQRLIYKGQILKDEKTLVDYGALIPPPDRIYMCL